MTKGKATAKGRKPSGARGAAPPGWITGDFLASTVTEADLLGLVDGGLIAEGSWRLPGKEVEPEPHEDERVLLLTHVERGFSLPPHPFFRGFLNFFGAQLHHFAPNTMAYLAAYVTFCECFLGCPPHWGLFKHIFTVRSQTVKKANPTDGKTNVIQLCGGLGIQKRTGSSFPPLTFPDSVRGWQSTWFYCKDVAAPNMSTGLPPFSLARPTAPRTLAVSAAERPAVDSLVNGVVELVRAGVTGLDLLEVFLSRRIQPLKMRDHPMWLYSGPGDSTRSHPEEVSEETVGQWLTSITGQRDNPHGAKRVQPFSAENPPTVVCYIFVE